MGGKASKGTPADRRLKENQVQRPQRQPKVTPPKKTGGSK